MEATTQQPTLVLGGTGKTGRRVVQRLEHSVSMAASEPVDLIQASFGVAAYETGESADRLVARADAVLYEAKRRRRHEAIA